MCDSGVILVGDIRCSSLSGVKGLMIAMTAAFMKDEAQATCHASYLTMICCKLEELLSKLSLSIHPLHAKETAISAS